MSTILAIETSCDETASAVVHSNASGITILSNVISSQISLHAPYGGVVPNLAAREHLKNFAPIVSQSLNEANITVTDIDALAVTNAPGLIPALLVGTTVAKTLSWMWKKPLLGIHHIEGHIYANTLSLSEEEISEKQKKMQWKFPLLVLVVSGGHTQLILMREHFNYEIIGETQDDAAGEAFDKVARILGLGYPGGPEISKRAQIARQKTQSLQKLQPLPRPMLHSNNFHFSFSGLKTATLYQVKQFRETNQIPETDPLPEEFINAICLEFENATIEVLVTKTLRAATYFNAQTILLAGGVSANKHLQQEMRRAVQENLPSTYYSLPPTHCITDNAAMIGAAAIFRWDYMNSKDRISARNNWKTLPTFAESPISQHFSNT